VQHMEDSNMMILACLYESRGEDGFQMRLKRDPFACEEVRKEFYEIRRIGLKPAAWGEPEPKRNRPHDSLYSTKKLIDNGMVSGRV